MGIVTFFILPIFARGYFRSQDMMGIMFMVISFAVMFPVISLVTDSFDSVLNLSYENEAASNIPSNTKIINKPATVEVEETTKDYYKFDEDNETEEEVSLDTSWI